MNRRLKNKVFEHERLLKQSDKTMRDVFNIMFTENTGVMCEDNDGYRIYRHTFSEMHERILRAAGNLYDRIGAAHSYVAVEMENGVDWVIAFWAILASGNKPYLVNLRYPASLTEGIYKTLGIKYTVCKGETAVCGEAIDIASLETERAPLSLEHFEDEIAFSSSATSMNEVICFYHGCEVSEQVMCFKCVHNRCSRIGNTYKGQVKQLAFLPFYHIYGLFAVYLWFSFFGATMVFLRDYSSETILSTVRRHEVTHVFAVPMLWHSIEKKVMENACESGKEQKLRKVLHTMTKLQNVFPNLGANIAKRVTHSVTDKLFGRSVQFTINGGAYIRDSALWLMNGLGYSLHNGFGMSEVAITSVELRKKAKHLNENSIGRPFDSFEYRIDDEGVLHIKGPSICKRKLVNGEEVIIDGWFNTGDIVEVRDGNYYIHGRKGDVVIGESGENINPDDIESLLSSSSAKALSVLGLKGNDGEVLSAVVQISPYASADSVSRLRSEIYALNDTLPTTSRVRAFYFTREEIAPPSAIKVSRKQLLRRLEAGLVTIIPFGEIDSVLSESGEESPLAAEVRAVIAKVLGISEADIASSTHIFYDLGATSIQYFSILGELSEQFGLGNYSNSSAYSYTVKDLCEYIERQL